MGWLREKRTGKNDKERGKGEGKWKKKGNATECGVRPKEKRGEEGAGGGVDSGKSRQGSMGRLASEAGGMLPPFLWREG